MRGGTYLPHCLQKIQMMQLTVENVSCRNILCFSERGCNSVTGGLGLGIYYVIIMSWGQKCHPFGGIAHLHLRYQ